MSCLGISAVALNMSPLFRFSPSLLKQHLFSHLPLTEPIPMGHSLVNTHQAGVCAHVISILHHFQLSHNECVCMFVMYVFLILQICFDWYSKLELCI